MLAPEDEGRAIDALRFSLASDIVELVVLTGDDPFLQTLREAVGPSRRLWHVPSADKVSDLLVAGGVGILVLDVQMLQGHAHRFITEIKRQFPDLVIVAAGARDDETALARLISEGVVYRFIHKPMSPGRARLFIDAAVKKQDEQRQRPGSVPAPAPRVGRANRPLRIAAAALAALSTALIAAWLAQRGSGGGIGKGASGVPAARPASPASGGSEMSLDLRAAQALAANRLTAPSGDNALELYLRARARNPADADARAGLAEVRERLLARAENALLEERLDEAAGDIETARRAGVESGRIAFLTTQLAKARELLKTAANPAAHAKLAPPPAGTAAGMPIGPSDTASAAVGASGVAGSAGGADSHDRDASGVLLKSAEERLEQDRLIEPDNDSALYYALALRRADPADPGLPPLMQHLASRLITKARGALGLAQFDAARRWLEAAHSIGLVGPEADALESELEAGVARRGFMSNVVSAEELTLVKSVQAVYPLQARASATEGWVDLEFTVTETGAVQDVVVLGATPPGVFEQAAMGALSQWLYKPAIRDSKPAAQRARVRIRFALSG